MNKTKIVNPICNGQDPFILAYNNTYYHYTQSCDDSGFHVYVSDDLQNWKDAGRCLCKDDCIGDSDFWAPEVVAYKNKFFMVYSANMHLAIAVADTPLGPFTQKEKRWLFDAEAIDGHIWIENGSLYLFYVAWGFSENHAVREEIWGAEMTEDFTVRHDTVKRLIVPEKDWETIEGNVTEGPYILKHNGKYYMTYSANNFTCQNYAIGYAVSDMPLGEYVKYEKNPILKSGDKYIAPGHNSFVRSIADNELYCVYHIHHDKYRATPRKICISAANFVPDQNGIDVLNIENPL